MLPLSAILIAIFVGWYLDKRLVKDEITNKGSLSMPLYPVYSFILRYVAPVGITLIFINELGWL